MSRHTIPSRNPQHEIVVGWDHPLQTYFGIVYDKAKLDTDKEVILWVGTRPRELYEIDDLRKALVKHTTIPPVMRVKLYGDKDDGL